jgi:putative addiction module CopG family antidote
LAVQESVAMEVEISEEYITHIRKLVDSGRYPSVDAVIARALALLEERDLADSDPAIAAELAEVRKKVMEGIDDLRNGRHTKYETADQLVADVKKRAKERRERESARERAIVG